MMLKTDDGQLKKLELLSNTALLKNMMEKKHSASREVSSTKGGLVKPETWRKILYEPIVSTRSNSRKVTGLKICTCLSASTLLHHSKGE
eukprot:scaffold23297_cov132-Cylindrotheca_fusiformis.AAC.15